MSRAKPVRYNLSRNVVSGAGEETGEGVRTSPGVAQLTVRRRKSEAPAGSHSPFPQDVRAPRQGEGWGGGEGAPKAWGDQDTCEGAGHAEEKRLILSPGAIATQVGAGQGNAVSWDKAGQEVEN